MTEADLKYHATWKASSGHPGGWRVTRQFFPPLPNPRFEELDNKRGHPILFRSMEAAARRAAELNKASEC